MWSEDPFRAFQLCLLESSFRKELWSVVVLTVMVREREWKLMS